MKKNLIWGMLALTAIAYTSCKKDDAVNSPDASQDFRSIPRNGVVADRAQDIARVPLYVSNEFIQNGGALTTYVAPDPSSRNGGAQAKGAPVKTTRDNTPPTISITSPSNGATVSGTVTISVNASDNVGVTSVFVTVNGSTLNVLYAAPYNFTWQVPSVTGTYTIAATAKDAKGNSSTFTIAVTNGSTSTGGGTGGGGTTGGTTNLPSRDSIKMMPVMYQGPEGSCVTLAVVAARSAEQFYKRTGGTGTYSYSQDIFSPEFMYNQTKTASDCGSGTSIFYSMEFLLSKGSCFWSSMPYDYNNGCSLMPNSTQLAEAINGKILSYSTTPTTDIVALKTLLSNKHPLVISCTMDASMYNSGPGFIWNHNDGTNYGQHALAICGYDDSKQAFKAINDYGTSWGDQGYVWIDYNFLSQLTYYAYSMRIQ